MMTLQNDPPSLESVSEFEDQYKHYGKSIRKLIVDCLQKDPTKRPTASELLKHPFIKKAKDRRYLMQTLLPITPSFAERSRRALDGKRCGFDSGNDGGSGSWVWPPEDGNKPNVMFPTSEKASSIVDDHSHSSGSANSTTDVGSSNDTYGEDNNVITDHAVHFEQKLNLDSKPCDELNDSQQMQEHDCVTSTLLLE